MDSSGIALEKVAIYQKKRWFKAITLEQKRYFFRIFCRLMSLLPVNQSTILWGFWLKYLKCGKNSGAGGVKSLKGKYLEYMYPKFRIKRVDSYMKNRRSKLTGVGRGLTRMSARFRDGTSPYRVLEAVSQDCIRSDRCDQAEGVRICSLCCKGTLWGY